MLTTLLQHSKRGQFYSHYRKKKKTSKLEELLNSKKYKNSKFQCSHTKKCRVDRRARWPCISFKKKSGEEMQFKAV